MRESQIYRKLLFGKYMGYYIDPPQNQIPGWSKILEDVFGQKDNGYFVEVGAYDGVWWSPCRTLALAKWSGIFYEPQTDAYNKLCENYADYRDRIQCIKMAISNYSGRTELFLSGSISTIHKQMHETYLELPEFACHGFGDHLSEFVDVSTLDDELTRRGVPKGFDVLSIDVEGSELDVLDSFDIEYWQPIMIVVEAREHHWESRLAEKAEPINYYMESSEYDKIYSDHLNNIYVKRTNDADTPA